MDKVYYERVSGQVALHGKYEEGKPKNDDDGNSDLDDDTLTWVAGRLHTY